MDGGMEKIIDVRFDAVMHRRHLIIVYSNQTHKLPTLLCTVVFFWLVFYYISFIEIEK